MQLSLSVCLCAAHVSYLIVVAIKHKLSVCHKPIYIIKIFYKGKQLWKLAMQISDIIVKLLLCLKGKRKGMDAATERKIMKKEQLCNCHNFLSPDENRFYEVSFTKIKSPPRKIEGKGKQGVTYRISVWQEQNYWTLMCVVTRTKRQQKSSFIYVTVVVILCSVMRIAWMQLEVTWSKVLHNKLIGG